jgi:hypothetical protein
LSAINGSRTWQIVMPDYLETPVQQSWSPCSVPKPYRSRELLHVESYRTASSHWFSWFPLCSLPQMLQPPVRKLTLFGP